VADGQDVCVGDFTAQGAAVMQFGAIPGGGVNHMRVLARHALGYHYRGLMSQYLNAKSLPNGKWILAQAYTFSRAEIALIKVPPIAHDSIARETFVPVAADGGSNAPEGATNVIAEFGYDSSFHCSPNRAERCLANKVFVDESVPYLYPAEAPSGAEAQISGAPCAAGRCTVVIPAYSSRVVYYRLKYRDDAGNVLATGPVQVVATP
jgi:hypothetical protein